MVSWAWSLRHDGCCFGVWFLVLPGASGTDSYFGEISVQYPVCLANPVGSVGQAIHGPHAVFFRPGHATGVAYHDPVLHYAAADRPASDRTDSGYSAATSGCDSEGTFQQRDVQQTVYLRLDANRARIDLGTR